MRLAWATGWVALILLAGAHAAGANEGDPGVKWLERIQAAPARNNYTGVFVFQQGASVQSSRITHIAEGGNSRERLEMLDGQPREFIRYNDEVRCLLPETRTVRIERSGPRERFPALIQSSAGEIAAHYDVRRIGGERVAGFETDVLELIPRDALRYGYRFWAERHTGLPLKAQTLDSKGAVVEQIAFSEIRIGAGVDRSLLRPRWRTEGWKIENATAAPTPASAWRIESPVPGFKKVRELQRTMAAHPEVLQIVYSDGLAAVSVFVEPLHDGQPREDTSGAKGALNMIGQRHGDYWITVLGDVPLATIREFASAVEDYQPDPAKP